MHKCPILPLFTVRCMLLLYLQRCRITDYGAPPRLGVIVTSKKNLIPKGYNTFLHAEFKRARVSTVLYRAMSCRIVPCHTLTCQTVPSPVVLCPAMLACYTVPCLTVPCRTVADLWHFSTDSDADPDPYKNFHWLLGCKQINLQNVFIVLINEI